MEKYSYQGKCYWKQCICIWITYHVQKEWIQAVHPQPQKIKKSILKWTQFKNHLKMESLQNVLELIDSILQSQRFLLSIPVHKNH